MKRSTRSAFTLVEIMIVVAILVDLAVVALPAFMRSRDLAQNSRFVSDLRTCSGSFEMYAAENNGYPPSTPAGMIPPGMSVYLRGFPWTSTNTLGGQWVWSLSYQGNTAAVVTQFPFAMDELRMTDVDMRFDDGILATGSFREADSQHFYFIIEP